MLPNNDISFQLYSSRNFPPLGDQLATLKSLGFTDVQPYFSADSDSPEYADPASLRDLLARVGLTSKTGHYDLGLLRNDLKEAAEVAKTIGNELVVAPWLKPEERPHDRAGWEALAAEFVAFQQRLGGEGLRFAWHTHDFEFRPLPDGVRPIEILLGDTILWEPDIAWIVRAWADPVVWLRRYAGRITAVHVKDTAPAGRNLDESGWADLGKGVVPWADLLPVVVESGAELLVLEHDNPLDYQRFAAHSIVELKRLAGFRDDKVTEVH